MDKENIQTNFMGPVVQICMKKFDILRVEYHHSRVGVKIVMLSQKREQNERYRGSRCEVPFLVVTYEPFILMYEIKYYT